MPTQDTAAPAPSFQVTVTPSAPPSPHPSHPSTPDDHSPSSTRSSRDRRRVKHASFAPTRSAKWYERVDWRKRGAQALKHRWFSWIPPKLTKDNFKVVARCTIPAWCMLVLQLIRPVETVLGYAAFFGLVVAFMLPPNQPVVQNLEAYLNLYFFCGLAWAWSCLGIFIAGRVRSPVSAAKVAAAEAKYSSLESDPTVYQLRLIYEATYLEAKSAVVCAVFLAVGTGALLWYKMRTQPSPNTFPLVLSCILVDISLTTAALYPYPLYTSGLLFFLPMAVDGGLSVLATFLIFPQSVGASFQGKFHGILKPLSDAMTSIETLFVDREKGMAADHPATLRPDGDGDFETDPRHMARLEYWAEQSKAIRSKLLESLSGLPPLRAQQHYLNVDFSYGRLSGHDLRDLFDHLASLQTRSSGLAFFFDVICTNARHTHIDSSAFSVHVATSRPNSRPSSRPASVREMSDMARDSLDDEPESPQETPEHDNLFAKRFHVPGILHRRSSPGFHPHRGSHISLLDHLRKVQQPVGVYESQRYMDIEKQFSQDTEHVLEQLNILADVGSPLVAACRRGLTASTQWLDATNRDRHLWSSRRRDKVDLEGATAALQSALDDFQVSRLKVVKPYGHVFDPSHPASEELGYVKLHYRGLFQNFVAQHHLIEFSEALLKLLRLEEKLETTRPRRRFWYPRPSSLVRHVQKSQREKHLTDGNDGHDNDQAFEEDAGDMLGEAKKRNPEYMPFESPVLNLLSRLATVPDALTSRSFMFAIKAAAISALTTLPNFIATSSAFYYYNRGVWVTIMSQLTLAVFSGDTTVAWMSRVVASFWGCIFGMVIWYIGCGSGNGNAYGLGAACAVFFPIAMFFRVSFPGPVLTAVMLPVTCVLVIGYSYLNGTVVQLTYAKWGWDVAWRRFVTVMIGITAAWIFSYLPPVYSAKRALRSSYAQVIAASGVILCDILSHANDSHHQVKENIDARMKLLSWRSKLNKLRARHTNASNEYSFKGRWPEERYKALLETLEDLLSLLAQINHVLCQLERPWRKALLERTRLADPLFLGDVLAVISMCSTSLRSGTALPQITPSPLVARFRMGKIKGLDLPHDPADVGELPSLVTIDVLESDNYMKYALGISTCFSIMSRLDRVVVTCKTLLGENYHISGLHFENQQV